MHPNAMEPLIVFGAKYLFAIVALGAALPLLWLKAGARTKYIITAAMSGVIAFAFQKAAGMAYFDPRPFTQGARALIEHSAENGFPSDHTALAFVAATLAVIIERRLGFALLALATIVAICRVQAGVHRPIDVVAGALIGSISVLLARATVAAIWRRRLSAQEESGAGK